MIINTMSGSSYEVKNGRVSRSAPLQGVEIDKTLFKSGIQPQVDFQWLFYYNDNGNWIPVRTSPVTKIVDS